MAVMIYHLNDILIDLPIRDCLPSSISSLLCEYLRIDLLQMALQILPQSSKIMQISGLTNYHELVSSKRQADNCATISAAILYSTLAGQQLLESFSLA